MEEPDPDNSGGTVPDSHRLPFYVLADALNLDVNDSTQLCTQVLLLCIARPRESFVGALS